MLDISLLNFLSTPSIIQFRIKSGTATDSSRPPKATPCGTGGIRPASLPDRAFLLVADITDDDAPDITDRDVPADPDTMFHCILESSP
jgi:hypothetical protein